MRSTPDDADEPRVLRQRHAATALRLLSDTDRSEHAIADARLALTLDPMWSGSTADQAAVLGLFDRLLGLGDDARAVSAEVQRYVDGS